MTIAEFFINLGVKGADGVGKALKGVKDGMGGISESSLAAKAAVLGVVYGLERLTGFASQIGMDLNKFATTTGLSTHELQKWQYAMGRFDVTADATASTIKNVQNAMTDMMLGKGAPGALDLLADSVGFDPKKADDTFYVMGKLQAFAKKEKPGVAHSLLKDFGIDDNFFQGMKSMDLSIDKLNKEDFITKRQERQLTEINKAWKDFWFGLRTMGVKIVAEEGLGAVTELGGAFKFLKDAAIWVVELIEKFQFLKIAIVGIGIALAIYFAPITALIAGIILVMSDIQKFREGKDSVTGKIAKFNPFGEAGETAGKANPKNSAYGNMFGVVDRNAPPPIAPNSAPGMDTKGAVTHGDINTTVHINDVPDAASAKDDIAREIDRAHRQYTPGRR